MKIKLSQQWNGFPEYRGRMLIGLHVWREKFPRTPLCNAQCGKPFCSTAFKCGYLVAMVTTQTNVYKAQEQAKPLSFFSLMDESTTLNFSGIHSFSITCVHGMILWLPKEFLHCSIACEKSHYIYRTPNMKHSFQVPRKINYIVKNEAYAA